MSKPAVIFGGPSDEHDISILTGLQVTRALGEVHAVFWSQNSLVLRSHRKKDCLANHQFVFVNQKYPSCCLLIFE